MTPVHLTAVGEALADASASHPRVHSVWLTLLSLLIPGFTPVKVKASPLGKTPEFQKCSHKRCLALTALELLEKMSAK